jgi:hypothetical protein
MATAILIAKILAVVYLSLSVGYIANRKLYKTEFPKLLDNFSFMLFGGMMAIVLGCLILNAHNTWNSDWTFLITLIGWGAVIKGVIMLAFPKAMNVFKPLYKGKNMDAFMAIPVIVGLVFAYFGFLA